MKIPETSANIGAYYNNEENGQWQPNGVIIDSGVGGGVVGSGDAGIHRPPVYPVHIPRGHIPAGYVMAGAYYPPAYPPAPPAPQDDFADYMWMENEEEFDKQDDFADYMWMGDEEEFDKQVMQQLEEEALMEQCIEAMLEDEQREQRQRPVPNGHNHPTTSNGSGTVSLQEAVSRSTLNPLAAEFVPNRARQPPGREKGKREIGTIKKVLHENQPFWWGEQCCQLKDEKKAAENAYSKAMTTENFKAYLKINAKFKKVIRRKKREAEEKQPVTDVKSEVKTKVESAKEVVTERSAVDVKQETQQSKTEDLIPTPTEPPEVSAADILPIDTDKDKRPPKDAKKDAKPKQDVKKTPKVDVKAKAKPIVVKSETKVQPKKKEVNVKAVKSEVRVEEIPEAPVVEVVKQSTPPVTEESTQVGIKPINYAAAAKANKPKKPATPPVTEKTPPQAARVEKIEKKPTLKDGKVKNEKTTPKTEKPSVQRKNSMK